MMRVAGWHYEPFAKLALARLLEPETVPAHPTNPHDPRPLRAAAVACGADRPGPPPRARRLRRTLAAVALLATPLLTTPLPAPPRPAQPSSPPPDAAVPPQAVQPPATAPGTAASPVAAEAQDTGVAGRTQPPGALATLNGVVLLADGRPAAMATVVARSADAGAPAARAALTDSLGRFTIDSLRAGSYDVRALHPQARQDAERRVDVAGTTGAELVFPRAPQPRLRWTVLFLVLYATTIIAVRWHHIARSIHMMLMSQLTALSTRLDTEVDADDERLRPLRATVDDLKRKFDPYRWGPVSRIGEFFFWSRGNENAGWVAIHEIERQLAAFLAPPESVETYLVWAEAQLRVVGTAPAIALAESITNALQPGAADDPVPASSRLKARKALLGRAISVIYTERDTKFATLMEWHNKASWLILAALVIIGFLAAAAGNAVLFLAGGAGGFLSRVMRALKREDVPLDYGASWTTLFLSPLFGALAGWFGIAIVALATSEQVNLLGDAFAVIDWYDPLSPFALAVAFLLGFSERFFDAVVGAVERHAAGAEAAEQAALVTSGRAASGTQVQTPLGAPRAPRGEEPGPQTEARVAELELPDEPVAPVQIVRGRIVLSRPAELDTIVALTSSHADYAVTPADPVIRVGESEADFELVPVGEPDPATVRITARVGDTELHGTVQYG